MKKLWPHIKSLFGTKPPVFLVGILFLIFSELQVFSAPTANCKNITVSTTYDSIDLSFNYQASSMENGEVFWERYSDDGNDKVYFGNVLIEGILAASSYYCDLKGDTDYDTGITLVDFNTISNASDIALNDYSDFTSISTTIAQSSTHNLTINLNTAGNWTIYSRVWIDWNQDSDFDDAGEEYDLGFSDNTADGPTSLSPLSITVPSGAVIGTTRMRVGAKWDAYPTLCESPFDGEVEDYTIIIIAACSAPIIDVVENGTACYGALDGSATASASGGSGFGYTYLWDNGETAQTALNLAPGVHTVTVSDSTGCSSEASITISESDIMILEGSTSTPESCIGCNDISIIAGTTTGGSGVYEYSIDGQNWQSSQTFDNLSSGRYTVYARDSNGCVTEEAISNYTNFTEGAAVIDMGISPQTENNALKPYGLVYDLVLAGIPVYWVIDSEKTFVNSANITNEIDLIVIGTATENGNTPVTINLKAGPFLIPSEFMAVAGPILQKWIDKYSGLTVYWNLDSIENAPVSGVINFLANILIYPDDDTSGSPVEDTDIYDGFFSSAGISLDNFDASYLDEFYRTGLPSDLTECDQVYILGHHTDPDKNWSQEDVDAIYAYVAIGGDVWMGCHDVSLTENLLRTSNGIQLNFLSKSGLIPYKDLNDVSINYPWLSDFADGNDEIKKHNNNFNNADILYTLDKAGEMYLQFINEIHPALNGNSEKIYVPFPGASGGWRPSTIAVMYDPNHPDISSSDPVSRAAIVVYGHAYGNTSFGRAFYQGSHINNQNGGTSSEWIGEKRLFGNYLLQLAAKPSKQIEINDLDSSILACSNDGLIDLIPSIYTPFGNAQYLWEIEKVSGPSGDELLTLESYNTASSAIDVKEVTGTTIYSIVLTVSDTPSVGCVTPIISKHIMSLEISNCTLDFDGIDDYIDLGKNLELNTNFSIEVWVKPNSETLDSNTNDVLQTIFSKRDANNLSTGFDLRLENDKRISFNWDGSGKITSDYDINPNRWYHIAVTFNGSSYKLYIDGIEVVNPVAGSAPSNTPSNVKALMGAMSKSGLQKTENFYSGWSDELRIWNVVLTQEQIHQMMNQEIEQNGTAVFGSAVPRAIYGLNWSNLEGYYQMNQNFDVKKGYLTPNVGLYKGKLKNISTWQGETAPLPYTTIDDKTWFSTATWTHGDVWNVPNGLAVDNSTRIDWNIVELSNTVKSKNAGEDGITLLGLIVTADGELIMADKDTPLDETNIGRELLITHYLRLDGVIDLVGESQLIQKPYWGAQYYESELDESSTGYIEKDQQGIMNSFAYNYWAAPVSKIGAGGNNTPVTVGEILRDGTNSNAPINLSIGAYADYDWADGPRSTPRKVAGRWIWKYVNDFNAYSQWKFLGGSSDTVNPTEGFTMKGVEGSGTLDLSSENQNYVFIGKPNNAPFGVAGNPLVHTTFAKPADPNSPNISLTGNPFPSALDANQFLTDNVNSTDGQLYFWEHWSNNTHKWALYQGGYAIYNLTGGVASAFAAVMHENISAGSTPRSIPGRYVPVGQGFYVISSADGGDVVFKNSQREFIRETEHSGSNSVFIKGNNKKEKEQNSNKNVISTDEVMRIRLGFESPDGNHRQVLVGFLEGATDGIDHLYDGKAGDFLPNDAFFLQEDQNFVIQAFGEFNVDREIPIVVLIEENQSGGIQKFMIDGLENIPDDIEIYIKDNYNDGETYEIRNTSGFEISLESGEHKDRFALVFKSRLERLDEIAKIEDGVTIYMNNSAKEIVIQKTAELDFEQVTLFNYLGQVIRTWNKNINERNIILPVEVSTGVYIVSLETKQGTIAKKVLIK